MAIPAYARTRNIRLTVQAKIGNSVAVSTVTPQGNAANLTVPVMHSYRWADPESVRDPAAAGARAFVLTQWIQDGAGRRGFSILQADVYCRTKAPGAVDGDPFGLTAADIADALVDLFRGEQEGGVAAGKGGLLKAWFPIFDYTNPLEPADTGHCLFCVTPGGQEGMPSVQRALGDVNGYQRVTLQWAFRTTLDRTSPDFVYE